MSSKPTKKSENDFFFEQYAGPIALYNILDARSRLRPFLLPRNMKSKPIKLTRKNEALDITLNGLRSFKAGQLSVSVVSFKSVPLPPSSSEEGTTGVLKYKVACMTSTSIQKCENAAKRVTLTVGKLFEYSRTARTLVLVLVFRPWDVKSLGRNSTMEMQDIKQVIDEALLEGDAYNNNHPVSSSKSLLVGLLDLSALHQLRIHTRQRPTPREKFPLQSKLLPISLSKPQRISLRAIANIGDPLINFNEDSKCDVYMNITLGLCNAEDKSGISFDPPGPGLSPSLVDTSFGSSNTDVSVQPERQGEGSIPSFHSHSDYPYIFDSREPGAIRLDEDTKSGLSKHSQAGLNSLANHLETFHPHFKYQYYLDQYRNMHFTMERVFESARSTPNRSESFSRTDVGTSSSTRNDVDEISNALSSSDGKAVVRYNTLANSKYDNLIIFFRNKQQQSKSKSRGVGNFIVNSMVVMTYSQIVRKNKIRPGFSRLDELQKGVMRYSSSNKSHLTRQYFHPRLGLPLTESELQEDSEDEIDSAPLINQNNRLLDEFEDVSYEEKELIKIWNIFLEEYAEEILEKDLRHQFLLHVLNMWDNGLLYQEDVNRFMTRLDSYNPQIAHNQDTQSVSRSARRP